MGSLTPNLKLTIPTVGGDTGPLFAQEINGDLSIIDSIYGGVNSLSVAGNANVTATESQAQNLIQQLTGVLTGNITYFLPAVGAFYAIENATTGPFSLSVGCTGGGNVQLIPQGLSTWIWTDGSFTRLSNPPGWQEIATYLVSGAAAQTILLPAPFRRFRLTMQSVLLSTTNVSLFLQTSTNGGSSFTSTGYGSATANWRIDGTSAVGNNTGIVSAAVISGAMNNSNVYDGTIEIFPGSSAPGAGTFRSRGNFSHVNTTPLFLYGITAASSTDVGVNAVQIFPGGGTFSGTIIVEGLP